jgi:hypothetical protein
MKVINRTVKSVKKLNDIYTKLMNNQRLWNKYNNVQMECSMNPPSLEIMDFKANHIIRYTLR